MTDPMKAVVLTCFGPVIGATLPLARMGEAHELLENRRSYALHGKVAIDVVDDTVRLPPRAA